MKLRLHEGIELSDVTLATAHVYSLIVEGPLSNGRRYQVGVTEAVSPDNNPDYLRPLVFGIFEFVDALSGPSPVCYVGIKGQTLGGGIGEQADAWFEQADLHDQSCAIELTTRQVDLTRVLQQYFPGTHFQEGVHDGHELPTYQGAGRVILGELPVDNPHLGNIHMKIALVRSLADRIGFTVDKVYFETE